MDNQRLEARVQAFVEACVAGRPIEDDRVELKTAWPTNAHKTARQIAAHANASRGESILWIIGLDERRQVVNEVDGVVIANWWPPIAKVFDGVAPEVRTLVVPVGNGHRVTALKFDTSRGPYVVKTEGDNPVSREVPWRAANGTRSAYRHELLRSLIEEAQAPELELVTGSLSVLEHEPNAYGGRPEGLRFQVRGELSVYVSAIDAAMLPEHRQSWAVSTPKLGRKALSAQVSPPYRWGRYTQSGGRAREPVGHIEVLGNSGMFVHRPGQITVSLSVDVTEGEAGDLRFAPQLHVEVALPVDRSSKTSHLLCDLRLVVGSEEMKRSNGLPGPRTIARFEPAATT